MATTTARPADPDTLVALRAAGKRYRYRSPWVLRDIDLTVPRGARIEVRGANGAGKSTLLRMLAGATLPTRGRRVATRGLRVGYGPERLSPAPPFRAMPYLAHHARLRRLSRGDGAAHAAELAGRLGLTAALLHEPLRALSKGSLQKIVIVQALLARPALVVLDEPFAGLDADAAAGLHELLDELREAGAAVVLSDHREHATRRRADRIWSVHDGRVVDVETERDAVAVAVAVAVELPAMPGVVDHRTVGAGVRLVVAPSHSDRVLARLIAQRWHVTAVRADVSAGGVQIDAEPPAR